MYIETFGNKEKPVVLAIHPMFTGGFFLKNLIDYCKDDYFFIIPTMSGHYENSIYVSMSDEEKTITEFLKTNGIDKVAVLLGFSLGGNTAFDLFAKNLICADKVIVDSAPLFDFPAFIQRHFYKKYARCLKKIKNCNVNVVKELNKCFNGMGEAQKNVAPHIAFESLKNLILGCFGVSTPKLSIAKQSKLVFIYGSKDEARLCRPRIRKYKNATYIKLKGYGHCGLYQKSAWEYLKWLNLI